MNQNLNQGIEPPKKDNTLKIVLIIILSVVGVIIVGIVAFFFLIYTIFNKSIEMYEEQKEEIEEKWDENNNSSSNYDEDYNDEPTTEVEYNNITKIDYKSFKQMVDNQESFVIVISQTSCGHCIAYKPIFDEALRENNIQGYELDLQVEEYENKLEFLDNYDVEGTPTTMIFTNGIPEEETLVSVHPKEEITAFLKKYNVVK